MSKRTNGSSANRKREINSWSFTHKIKLWLLFSAGGEVSIALFLSPLEHTESIPYCLCHAPCCDSGTYLGPGGLYFSYANFKIHNPVQRNCKSPLIQKLPPQYRITCHIPRPSEHLHADISGSVECVVWAPSFHPVPPCSSMFLYLFILQFIHESRNWCSPGYLLNSHWYIVDIQEIVIKWTNDIRLDSICKQFVCYQLQTSGLEIL